MKKITLLFTAAGFLASSLGAYAALPTGAVPFQVVIPNLKSGMEVTLEGLYLQPTNADLAYGIESVALSNGIATSVSYIKPNYDLGFRAGFGFVFPNSGNDVQVAWTHFDRSTSASTTFVPLPSLNPNLVVVDNGDTNFKYDAIDLDVGQYVSIGTRLQTRFFIGMRGAQLKNDLATTRTTLNPGNPTVTDSVTANSKYTGIGPRIGVDTSYHVGGCFGIVGHFATALLVGNVDSSALLTSISSARRPTIVNVTTDTQRRVVPAFDAKLGVDYSIPFKNNASSLTIEAGYQVTQYLDAIDRVHSTGSTTSIAFGSIATSSVGFNGPYLSLNLKV